MRPARFFLACAAVSVLAACGTDPLGPANQTPQVEQAPAAPSKNTTECTGTLTSVIQPDGTVKYECVLAAKQGGSGG